MAYRGRIRSVTSQRRGRSEPCCSSSSPSGSPSSCPPEHQQLIVDAGALPLLVNLLKRHNNATNLRPVNSVIRRAADAITNLTRENSNIKTCVRIEGGIPPLVELLESHDLKVQRAADFGF